MLKDVYRQYYYLLIIMKILKTNKTETFLVIFSICIALASCYHEKVSTIWDNSTRTIQYQFKASSPQTGSTNQENFEIIFNGTTDALLRINNSPPFEVTFNPDGSIIPKPTPANEDPNIVPVYTNLFMVGPSIQQQPLTVGNNYSFKVPKDSELRDENLTIQSEVKVSVKKFENGILDLDFETYYKIIDNPALTQFKDDISDINASDDDTPLINLIDEAKNSRLAGYGTVKFDTQSGNLVSASFTGAGLPIESLTVSEIANHPDTINYEINKIN